MISLANHGEIKSIDNMGINGEMTGSGPGGGK